jgi:hypothetical protein
LFLISHVFIFLRLVKKIATNYEPILAFPFAQSPLATACWECHSAGIYPPATLAGNPIFVTDFIAEEPPAARTTTFGLLEILSRSRYRKLNVEKCSNQKSDVYRAQKQHRHVIMPAPSEAKLLESYGSGKNSKAKIGRYLSLGQCRRRTHFSIYGRKYLMNHWWSKRIAVIAAAAILISPMSLLAQGEEAPNAGTSALTEQQQSAANSALCSALSTVTPSPSTATAATLLTPAVLSTASSTFASSTHIAIGPATSLLRGYESQHATEILASCGINNATKGLGSEIPSGGSVPSMPKMP